MQCVGRVNRLNPIERVARAVDRTQQGFGPAAFVFGVMKKFGDDRAGSLAALIAYYGFLSLFPLLLLLVTVTGMLAGPVTDLAKRIEGSALSQFPIIGNELTKNITAIHRNSTPALIVAIVGLIWGAQGASQAGQFAMAEVWNVPGVVRPNYWSRLVRSLLTMALLGLFLLLSTGAAAITTFVHVHGAGRYLGDVLNLAINLLLFVIAFRVLTPKQIHTKLLWPGALLGGVAWTVLLLLGGFLVNHELRNVSAVYGFFAIVLGLIWWIFIGAQLTLYAAETNVVLARRLWPRSMVQPPLTRADELVLAAIAKQGERRPEVRVSTTTSTPPATEETPAPDEATAEATSEAAPTEPPAVPDADDLGDGDVGVGVGDDPAASPASDRH